jgi:hypothetical protein
MATIGRKMGHFYPTAADLRLKGKASTGSGGFRLILNTQSPNLLMCCLKYTQVPERPPLRPEAGPLIVEPVFVHSE